VLAFTALCGSVLIFRGGWVISILVALALLCAVGYTAGPFSLAYLGLSEFFVLIFFGPVATGCTYYLQTLELSRAAFIAGLAPGLFSCAILIINHLRDVEEDRIAGRKNLICRFGTTFGKWEYTIALFAGLLIPLYFQEKHLLQLLCSLCVIPGALLIRIVMKNRDPHTYNLLLANTGKFLFLYSTIFSIGYIL
jgi:1,4-dihydroxy-2-naphthoate octaprenyltransferase